MADYPTYSQEAGSSEGVRDDVAISYARSGAVKARLLQSASKRTFRVVHKYLTDAQKASLITFLFTTKRNLTFTFAWNSSPGTTYTVVLANQGPLQFQSNGVYWETTVQLEEA